MQWTRTGPSIIDSTQNRENLTPLVSKLSELTQPKTQPLSVRTHQKLKKVSFLDLNVRTSASQEPPLSEKCPYWTNPLPHDCGRLL